MISRDLRYPGTPSCLEVVHDALTELWDAAPQVGDSDRMLFETALVEIVGNLVEHARRADGHPVDVHMRIAVHDDRLEARMEDNGAEDGADGGPTTFDPAAARLPEDALAESGRGLALAAAVADLDHVRRADGNVWTVVRHRT